MEKILPYILATLTQHDRQKVVAGVDFEWSKDSWTHNFFRAFELVFWRRSGIRAETSAVAFKNADGTTTTIRAYHSLESLLKFFEYKVRSIWNWKLVPVKVYLPVLRPAGMPTFSSPYLLAIAFVGAANNNQNGATTLSLTGVSCGTTNGLVFAFAGDNDLSFVITGISCADGALTFIENVSGGTRLHCSSWYKIGTTTATQTFTATSSTATDIQFAVSTYSGARQSAQPDAHNTSTSGSASSFSQSVTTVADNCWVMWALNWGNITGGALTAGANTTLRANDGAQGYALADTNAPQTPAGSKTMSVSKTGNDLWGCCIASFAPAVATANSGFFRAALQ